MVMGMGTWATRAIATALVAADGTGDFTDIQAAIDALPAGGGVVYIKEGIYIISTTINITKSNVTLVGAGAATIVRIANNTNIRNLRIGNGINAYSGIVVSEIWFDGNRNNNTSTLPVVHISASCSSCKIERCWVVEGDDDGILIDTDTIRTHCINNVIYNCDDNGINCAGATNGTILQNNFCYTCGGSGIRVVLSGGYTLVEGNICSDNTEYGIEVQALETNIVGNVCSGNTLDGIYLLGDHKNVIGNHIRYNKQNGIQTVGADYCVISGNYFYNNSYENDNIYSDILLGTTSTHNTVTGNQCHCDDLSYQPKYGIYEDSVASDYNLIVGNIVNGQQTDYILTQGVNSIEASNIEG